MAKKPTPAEVVARKQALLGFMEKHGLNTADVCNLLNEGSIRQTSLRTVQCWVADTDSPSSRTPPEDIAEHLAEHLKRRNKAAKADVASAERTQPARRATP